MQPDRQFRVISRGTAAALVLVIVGAGLVALWVTMNWLDTLAISAADLESMPPEDVLNLLVRLLKILALAVLVPLVPLCGFLIWHGRRAIQTGSMPPTGSWIVEGQRIRTGDDAVRAAKLLIGLTAGLAVAGVVAAAYLWQIATQLEAHGTLL